jgi:ParB-like chromosome segregation protein Spo0J
MQINQVLLNDIQPLDNNPRVIDKKSKRKLRDSLRAFELYRPLVCWKNQSGDTYVISGHQRLSIIKEMHEKGEYKSQTVPVVYYKGTEAEAKVVALRANQSEGDWDYSKLSEFVDDLKSLADDDFSDLSLTGFDASTLADLSKLSDVSMDNLDQAKDNKKESPSDDGKQQPGQNYVDHRFAVFTVGNLRGKLTMEVYGRWLTLFESYSKHLDTTDVGLIVDAMLEDLDH